MALNDFSDNVLKKYSKVLLRYNIGIYNNQGFSIVWFLIDVKLTCQLTHLSTPKHLSEFTYNCQMSVAGTFYVNSPLPLLLCSRSVKQFPECVSCFLRWQRPQTKEGGPLRKQTFHLRYIILPWKRKNLPFVVFLALTFYYDYTISQLMPNK